MFRKYYTDEDILSTSKEVTSMAELLRRLGLKPVGGNYNNMRRKLQSLNIDTSHWKGQGWNKNQQMKDWSDYTRVTQLKKHLIKHRSHQCENCKFTDWLSQPISLEVHHMDGDRTNNGLDNLQLLCPNCHSQTKNWKKKLA